MKKKLLSIPLAILMILAMISCAPAEKETAYMLVKNSAEKMMQLNDYDMTSDLNVKFGMSGITYSLPAKMSVKANGITTETPKLMTELSISIPMSGVEIALAVYSDGEYMYISALGLEVKVRLEDAMAEAPDNTEIQESFMEDYYSMLETALTDVEVITNKDKSKTVSYTLPGDEISAIVNKLFESVSGEMNMNEEEPAVEVNISDMTITQTISEDGYIISSKVSFGIKMSEDLGESGDMIGMDSLEISIDIDGTITLNDPGVPVEVIPMDGYESFEEYSEENSLEDLVVNM